MHRVTHKEVGISRPPWRGAQDWSEHRRVAEELGIDVFDHVTCTIAGGVLGMRRLVRPQPRRAL